MATIRYNKILKTFGKKYTQKYQQGGSIYEPTDYSEYEEDLIQDMYEEGGKMSINEISEKAKEILMSPQKDPNTIISFIFELAKPALSEEDVQQLQQMYSEEKPMAKRGMKFKKYQKGNSYEIIYFVEHPNGSLIEIGTNKEEALKVSAELHKVSPEKHVIGKDSDSPEYKRLKMLQRGQDPLQTNLGKYYGLDPLHRSSSDNSGMSKRDIVPDYEGVDKYGNMYRNMNERRAVNNSLVRFSPDYDPESDNTTIITRRDCGNKREPEGGCGCSPYSDKIMRWNPDNCQCEDTDQPCKKEVKQGPRVFQVLGCSNCPAYMNAFGAEIVDNLIGEVSSMKTPQAERFLTSKVQEGVAQEIAASVEAGELDEDEGRMLIRTIQNMGVKERTTGSSTRFMEAGVDKYNKKRKGFLGLRKALGREDKYDERMYNALQENTSAWKKMFTPEEQERLRKSDNYGNYYRAVTGRNDLEGFGGDLNQDDAGMDLYFRKGGKFKR